MTHIRLFPIIFRKTRAPSLCRLRLHKEESGIVFTLLRSGYNFPPQRNGTIPHRIPPVNAPATALPARPPVCSAPHFLNASLTSSTKKGERAPSASLPPHPRPHQSIDSIPYHWKILFRSVMSNKKDCKGSPRSVPCKGPLARRVRPVKISTAGKDEPAAHLPQEGGGRIFTDSTLTSPVPGAYKAVLFYFSFFFRVFLSVSFFRKQS